MLLGLVALPLVAIFAVGGPSGLVERLQDIDPNLLTASGSGEWNLNVIFGTISLAMIGIGFLGSPQIFVRFLALRDEGEIRKGAAVAILWTLLADSGAVLVGMIGRAALTEPGESMTAVLGSGAENVLPVLVESVMPAAIVGLYIAIVLAAIMSTVDSLLVVAGSAAVRDFYQKVRHPELSDTDLLKISRRVTFALALLALSVAMTVAFVSEERSIFWFVIFGWSGIAATFCPMMILSLFWKGMTARGALAAMLTGAASIPLFKFSAPHWPGVGEALANLGELPPSFLFSSLAGVLFSLGDERGRDALLGIDEEFDEIGRD
jgi:Na+/proline symporter